MLENGPESLTNLSDVSRLGQALINRIFDFVGGAFAPHQMKRLAKAEAESDLIKAKSRIEISALELRAMSRSRAEEVRYQANMEKIVGKAIPQLNEDSNPDQLDDDWIVNFFDKSRVVSKENMQDLWARILAGEANNPGSYSTRTVNSLASIAKSEAETFSRLCELRWTIGSTVSEPLVFSTSDAIYDDRGLDYRALSELDSIGLISFDGLTGFRRLGMERVTSAIYCGRKLMLEFKNQRDNELSIGHVIFTKTGRELASICGASLVEGFWEYVCQKLRSMDSVKTLHE